MQTRQLLTLTALISGAVGMAAGWQLHRPRPIADARPPLALVSPARVSPAPSRIAGVPPAPSRIAGVPSASGIAIAPLQGAIEVPPEAGTPSGTKALNLLRVTVSTNGATPEACLIFSAAIATDNDQHVADFLHIEPQTRLAIQNAGNRVCLGGLDFGRTYQLTIRAGLRAAGGATLLADDTEPLSLGDLPARADFADDGMILPKDAAGGLPVATVNLSHVHLRIDRITDRVLARTHLGEDYSDDNGEYDPETHTSSDTLGVPVWEGDLAIKPGERNQKMVTALPVSRLLGNRLPGAYRIALVRKMHDDDSGEDREQTTTRWIFDTDLMLTTHQGNDGLHVFARSLASATPVPGADIALLAYNNDELGRAASDANGEAVFPAGLLRGAQGHRPRMVMGYLGRDFTALQLDKPGFDLSDRGVDGRPDPGPVDGYLYADRGIYRPGETIELAAIVRDRLAGALPDGEAIVATLRRPDGVEAGHWRMALNAAGMATEPVVLNASAARGTWHFDATIAGTKTQVAALDVEVQDFVPNRLAVDLDPKAARLQKGQKAEIGIASRYLYGAPAANLETDAHIQLQPDLQPVAERGWSFGREGERLNADAQDITGSATDADGHATLTLAPDALKLPDTSLPLRADITVSVAEPGGRATESRVSLPVTTRDVLLGLRSSGEVSENHETQIEAAAFSPDGKRIARHAEFRLLEMVTSYNYYALGGHWLWRMQTSDKPVTFGSIDLPVSGAAITLPALDWGSYRLEITDKASGALTSRVLHVGFSGAGEGSDSPEKVSVGLIGAPPRAGGVAHLHIKPPFAGQLLLTVENSGVLAVRTAAIPEGGADVDVPVNADWGVGAYVVASVYRPLGTVSGHAPVRAIGLAHVKLDVSDRTLAVKLDTPAVLRPRTHLDLHVTLSGPALSADTYVTVAAVDEGILQLTRFATPDPAAHFFGKRQLGTTIRDDYNHVIDGNGAEPGEVRAGGDMDGAGLTVVPTRTTALFSGLVRVGPRGEATIPVDLPDFTGGLRLMAVAAGTGGFGHVEVQVPVRDPVVAQISLPRFLAPGDAAQLTLLAHNVEAPAGAFHIHIAATDALAMAPVDQDIPLGARESVIRTYPLQGAAPGIGKVVLTLSGPDGMRISHDWDMQVRTPFQSVARTATADLAPGATLAVPPSLAEGLEPHSVIATATLSAVGGIDLPGLLQTLDEYPFGCSEQLVSRAMPLLYVEDESRLAHSVVPADVRQRVQDAVTHLLERQGENGAFGLWRVGDEEAEPYLGGEITDFLTRARAHGYAVPEHALTLAAKGLEDFSGYVHRRFWFLTVADLQYQNSAQQAMERAGRAYALLIAARANNADIADLRYMHDAELDALEPLGRAQLATGLALMGDRARAAHAWDAAMDGLAQERDDMVWRVADFYRTRLRDTAAMLALAAELKDRDHIAALTAALSRLDLRPAKLTTQEQASLAIAAGMLLEQAGPVQASVDGKKQAETAILTVRRSLAGIAEAALRNDGPSPVTGFTTVRGLPLAAPPASASGVTLIKQITAPDGTAVALDHLKQNQRLVVHLFGHLDDVAFHQTMVVDPLPAGFEIERVVAPSTKDNANGLPWLGEITKARFAEKHDDRFLAAVDLGDVAITDDDGGNERIAPRRDFNVAYVVRVVSPGRFALPAASIRDMYRDDVQARGEVGHVTVEAAK